MKSILLKLYLLLLSLQQVEQISVLQLLLIIFTFLSSYSLNKGSQAISVSESTPHRYCQKCQQNFPLRSYHVNQINKCVSSLDHFCTLLDIEIGDQNFYYFFQTVLLLTILAFCNLFINIIKLQTQDQSILVLNLVISIIVFPISFFQLLNAIMTITTGKLQQEEYLQDEFDFGLTLNFQNFTSGEQILWGTDLQKKNSKLYWWLENDYWSCF
ncbi:Palmitoyltransferase [Spironucleus salmonicida]|uniref:Palmitoyltransferase n=1 Tax=Spironucleus salmonicida TaxID=348837 RepID=V6LRZ4_9EUKA|nr:Palmitoyltransferase [Spironucleus salmonicida]|eukprot:EST46461.1 DHHC zinc finger and transmembrane domain-containing protein [Spironucleus salmonicida]